VGSAVKVDKELKNLHDLEVLFGVTKDIVCHTGIRQLSCLLLSLFYIHEILLCFQSGSYYVSGRIFNNWIGYLLLGYRESFSFVQWRYSFALSRLFLALCPELNPHIFCQVCIFFHPIWTISQPSLDHHLLFRLDPVFI